MPTPRRTLTTGRRNSAGNSPPGWFGENLRADGVDVSGARIGERWRLGSTVVVEVTSPRTPCATFARWVGGEDECGWVKRFTAARRHGAYLRVVTSGEIEAGDPIEAVFIPGTAATVAEVLAGDRSADPGPAEAIG
ncbi:MAG: MOSC domain-containing protein [Lacisediminihabitans sp.]